MVDEHRLPVLFNLFLPIWTFEMFRCNAVSEENPFSTSSCYSSSTESCPFCTSSSNPPTTGENLFNASSNPPTTDKNPFLASVNPPTTVTTEANPRRRYRGRGRGRRTIVKSYAPKPQSSSTVGEIAEDNPFLPSKKTPKVSRKRVLEVEHGRNVQRKLNVCRKLKFWIFLPS